MPQPSFVHLRLHSEFSIVDGIVRLDDAVARAAADGMGALALTDLGNVFGMVDFYKAARKSGVKPIVGCDVWITNDAERDKPHRLLLKLVLPSALPQIMTGLRLGLIYAWLATIGAEYLFTTTTGIGSMMMDARDLFRMDLVILGMAVIGGIGFALNLILSRLGRLSLWRGVEEML